MRTRRPQLCSRFAVGLRRLPLPARRHRRRRPLVPALWLVLRDVEELLTERGIEVDHVSIYRLVLWFTPLLAEAARPCRHRVGARWWVDETYVKVAGRWRYVYRAIDQFGQVVDVFVSRQRDTRAARRFFEHAIGTTKVTPVEVVTDHAPVYPGVLKELAPAAWHRTDQYANNRVEADHGRLKARPQAGPQRQGRDRRACLRAERSARLLRTGGRGAGEPASGSRLRRIRPGNLIRRHAPGLQHAAGWHDATDPSEPDRAGSRASPHLCPTRRYERLGSCSPASSAGDDRLGGAFGIVTAVRGRFGAVDQAARDRSGTGGC
jgi:transposase-like protein